jgi:hypothetical protein
MARMTETEAWSTSAEILAKRLEFEAALGPQWHRAAAWGVLHEDENGGVHVDRCNVAGVDEHHLPAAILATVLGHPGGTASIPFGAAEMDRAIELLTPAEACTEFGHPNLWAWRALRSSLGPAPRFTAVYTDAFDLVDPADRYLDALLKSVHRGRQENADGTTTLWRPVGPAELSALRAASMLAWPARLPDQPIFYPVLNEPYARQIAEEWNVAASGAGYVTRFVLPTSFARRYPTRQAGGTDKLELWVPAEDLDELNRHLVGPIEVISTH